MYTYSNYKLLSKRVMPKERMESGIESETKERIKKINEPISERYDNWAAFLRSSNWSGKTRLNL